MKGKRGLLLGSVAAAGIILLAIGLYPREPEYRGRSLSAWLADLDSARGVRFDPRGSRAAEAAIMEMGASAVPALRTMMRSRDSQLRLKIKAFCLDRPWIPQRFRLDEDRLQWRGVLGAYTLGPMAAPAIPELVNLLTNQQPWVRGRAAMALGKIGSPACEVVPQISRGLADPIADVRACTAKGLADLGLSAKPALPALVQALRESDDTAFSMVLRAVDRLGAKPDQIVPVLAEQLQQEDPRIRYQAATALGRFGTNADLALTALDPLLQDADKNVRAAAAAAILKIDPESAARKAMIAPPQPLPDPSGGSGSLALQGPASIALDLYRNIAGVQLVNKIRGPIPGLVNIRSTRPLSKNEAAELIEQALLDQCGIVLEHIDQRHVIVKMRQH